MAANWKVTDRWMLSPGYAFEQIHMHLDATSQDTRSGLDAEGSSPVHSAQLRSHVDLIHGISWDASAYFVDRLKSEDVPSYTRLDTGLTWRWTEELSMSVVGQNLAKDRHLEFVDSREAFDPLWSSAVFTGNSSGNSEAEPKIGPTQPNMEAFHERLLCLLRPSLGTALEMALGPAHRMLLGSGHAGTIGHRISSEGGVPVQFRQVCGMASRRVFRGRRSACKFACSGKILLAMNSNR